MIFHVSIPYIVLQDSAATCMGDHVGMMFDTRSRTQVKQNITGAMNVHLKCFKFLDSYLIPGFPLFGFSPLNKSSNRGPPIVHNISLSDYSLHASRDKCRIISHRIPTMSEIGNVRIL